MMFKMPKILNKFGDINACHSEQAK